MVDPMKKVAEGQTVYLDYPFDDCAIRVEPDGVKFKAFLTPYGSSEMEVDTSKNNRFWNALNGGDEITEEEYMAKAEAAPEGEEPVDGEPTQEAAPVAPEAPAQEPVMEKSL